MRGRIRSVKPELFKSEKLWDLQQATGLPVTQAFVGLWCYADREGRFEWKPRALKSDVLPYWDGDMGALLEALASKLFVVRYTVDGKDYGHITGWKEHQRPDHRETASVLPPPEAHGVTGNPLGMPGRAEAEPRSAQVEGNGMEGKGMEGSESRAPAHVATPVPIPEPPQGQGYKFRADWKPHKDDVARGLEYGLTKDAMRDRAEHCRLKLFEKPFSSEDEQFRRELLFMKKDRETELFREQRKANPHGLNENPGRNRRPTDPRPPAPFSAIAAGARRPSPNG